MLIHAGEHKLNRLCQAFVWLQARPSLPRHPLLAPPCAAPVYVLGIGWVHKDGKACLIENDGALKTRENALQPRSLLEMAYTLFPQPWCRQGPCYKPSSRVYLYPRTCVEPSAGGASNKLLVFLADIPPKLAAYGLAYTTNLFGTITHYASGQAAAYYGTGYLQVPVIFYLGAIIAAWNLVIWLFLGVGWMKLMGFLNP